MEVLDFKKKACLFLLIMGCCFAGQDSLAQTEGEWSVEQLVFSDGRQQDFPLFFDAYLELLYYKNAEGSEQKLMPSEVVSFSFQGDYFFSLPFNNGKFSFFKVEHEGADIALLSKSNSLHLIQYLSSAYVDRYQVCKGRGKNAPMQLCEMNLDGQLSAFGGYGNFAARPKPLSINHCLFVVGQKGLQLFRMEVEKENLLLGKRTRTVYFESLDKMLDPERLERAHQYALENKLEEDKLEALVDIFSFYSRL